MLRKEARPSPTFCYASAILNAAEFMPRITMITRSQGLIKKC